MKVFISQPMMNKPNDILQKERKQVVELLKLEGHEIVNTIFDIPNGRPLDYLAKSVEAMADADGVVFMKDWDMSRGCVVEYEIAMRYNKFVRIL